MAMKYKLVWHPNAWEDYLYWQTTDKKMIKKINTFLQETDRDPFHGSGKPEPLQYNLTGFWSRRLNLEHRLVYEVDQNNLIIHACRYHYE